MWCWDFIRDNSMGMWVTGLALKQMISATDTEELVTERSNGNACPLRKQSLWNRVVQDDPRLWILLTEKLISRTVTNSSNRMQKGNVEVWLLPDGQVAICQECLALFVVGNESDCLPLKYWSFHTLAYICHLDLDPECWLMGLQEAHKHQVKVLGDSRKSYYVLEATRRYFC